MYLPGFLFCVLATLYHANVDAIPTISAIGSKFFTSDGDQFFIFGVAYQLVANDPLADKKQCQLDASLMKELGANAIRVYHVDPLLDHDDCMKIFADAGIYLFVDLDSFQTYVKLDVIAWNQNKSDSYRQVMDEFQKYDNTAGFFVGNEVLNGNADSPSAPFLLAAVADVKAYRDARGYRKIPVGYSATDTDNLGTNLQNYLVCREDPLERVDFYSLNSYRWCGSGATYQTSGYVNLQKAFENYPCPVFISETGCNVVPPRDFADQAAIFGANMSDTWSGAMIYEWIQEMNDYGLISYGPVNIGAPQQGTTVIDGYVRVGTPTPIAPDFENLKNQWAAIKPSGIKKSEYTNTAVTPRPCPESTAGGWAVDAKAPLPTLGAVILPPTASGGYGGPPPSDTDVSAPTITKAQGRGFKVSPPTIFFADGNTAACVMVLLTLGVGVGVWL